MLEKSNKKPSALWLGPVVDESTMMASRSAVSPAANRWQYGLINALQDYTTNIKVLSHVPEPLWPKGRLQINSGYNHLAPGIQGELVNYWNVPFWRTHGLCKRYIAAFQTLCRTENRPSVIISYNDYPWNVEVGIYAQEKLGIPWICIVADGPGPNSGPEYVKHEELIKRAACRVFLSWGRYRSCQHEPKYHLDGGVTELRFDPDSSPVIRSGSKPIVMFAGAMTRWAGVTFLVQSFKEIKSNNVELWLCGPGSNRYVDFAVREDPPIKFLGLLDERRLQEISHQATVFINPRPSSLSDNRSNFPSKVLEYLSYGKPVISTWTEGLSPDYADVLIVLKNETTRCLAETIERVLSWSETERRENAKKAFVYLDTHKRWAIQAEKLSEWLVSNDLFNSAS